MKKIVLLPLDERPCNYNYPQDIFKCDDIDIVAPDMSIMGHWRTPANFEDISNFLLTQTKDAYGIVLSIDTLLYGGLIPSRLHYHSVEELKSRLEIIKKMKEQNPELIVYAFQTVQRCPSSSAAPSQTEYYAICGREIHRYGICTHKKELNLITEEEKIELETIEKTIKKEYLNDFIDRRDVNRTLNIEALNYLDEGIIDFLVIPQDDSSEYGFTAMDQEKIYKVIEEKELWLKVYIYPGADEVANTVLSKMVLNLKGKRPLFYIKYNSVKVPTTIPLYEDRDLDITVRYQILVSGGLVTENINEADIVLFVSANGISITGKTLGTKMEKRGQTVLRNMPEFMEFMDYCVNDLHKLVAVADITNTNAAEWRLISMMQQKNLLLKVASYAGWNTSSNTLGTTIPHAIMTYLYGKTENNMSFLMSRYIEDYVYMGIVRGKVNAEMEKKGMSYWSVDGPRGEAAKRVKEEMIIAIEEKLPTIKDNYILEDVSLPLSRMFEVYLKVKYK